MNSAGRALLVLPVAVFLLQCIVLRGSSLSEEGNAATRSDDVENPLVILDALIQAYPDKVESLEIREGDWSILIGGVPYFWAGGRMLPGAERVNAEKYSPYHFFPYPRNLPPLTVFTTDELKELEAMIERREARTDFRFTGFLKALWGMGDFLSAEEHVVRMEFLGSRIRIHPDIREALENVEVSILRIAETDTDTARWLENLRESGAYVWRDIAGSANRSLHSYGIAIDLIPKDYHGKQAYWRWAADFIDEWWDIPYTSRFQIPQEVIGAFEEQGFIWGGKWLLFDQIHFEYRPELIILGEYAGE